MVVPRPTRELLERAAAAFDHYMLLRTLWGDDRERAFRDWCGDLHLDMVEQVQIAHTRIELIGRLSRGELDYDDIDWSGVDVDRRASSTGTVWVASWDQWLAEV